MTTLDQRLEGRKTNDALVGDDGNDSLNGRFGNDTMTGDTGADSFELSTGEDVIEDFDLYEGDKITLPENIKLEELEIEEKNGQVVITAANSNGEKLETKLSANLGDVLAAIESNHKADRPIKNVPLTIKENMTVLQTGPIVKKYNSIKLPTKSEITSDKIQVFPAIGRGPKPLIEGDDYSISYEGGGTTIIFPNTDKIKRYRVAAEFEWNNNISRRMCPFRINGFGFFDLLC